MNEEPYRDGYEEQYEEFILPDFLGSHYEANAEDYVILDGSTGELLTKKYLILWADSKEGYFVEKKKTSSGISYKIHVNKNIQIIKTDDFYDEEDSEDFSV